jgi:hypothetical protein
MDERELRALLGGLRDGTRTVDEAVQRLRALPYEDIDFAKVDHHRALRCGFAEVIFGEGKTPEQIAAIFSAAARGSANVLATRVAPAAYEAVAARHADARHDPVARTITLRRATPDAPHGTVAILAAGTSDLPTAEEARVTAEIMDLAVQTFHDVGVAGLHRLLVHVAALQQADVLIVVAGMEGALPSVVGGLVAAPVIAVPTSVGYGASFGGLSALLAMLNSCAAGVTVVNIDNGFGAACAARRIVGARASL